MPILTALTAAICGIALTACVASTPPARPPGRPPGVPPRPPTEGMFPISGSVDGLGPGVERQLPLTVSNPLHYRITVTRLTGQVGDASDPCRAGYLQVSDSTGRLVIPAHEQRTEAVAVTMTATAPNACHDATWPLTFAGEAMRTRGGPNGTSNQSIDALAFTGSSTAKLLAAAFLMLAAGLLALLVKRHRQRRAPARNRGALAGSESS